MCKYFDNAYLEPEVRRLLISEFGSVENAKKDITIFSFHLPEKLQEQMIQFTEQKYPYILKNPSQYKQCFRDMNQTVTSVLRGMFEEAC